MHKVMNIVTIISVVLIGLITLGILVALYLRTIGDRDAKFNKRK